MRAYATAERRMEMENVVFDMGGVLIKWTPDEVLDNAEVKDEEDRRILKREVFFSQEWAAMSGEGRRKRRQSEYSPPVFLPASTKASTQYSTGMRESALWKEWTRFSPIFHHRKRASISCQTHPID